MRRRSLTRHALMVSTLLSAPLPALAQPAALTAASGMPAAQRNDPVTFTADQVEYDRDNALVIARGHVEAWQNDHVMRADTITFNRNSGVAAANGNVVLLEPDGQVVFADYAEMKDNMRNGILKDMRALLAENGRLAANGMRRTEGLLNELSRVVYSTCNLCQDDPNKPPLWQIRAASAVQDLEHKKIEYQDAVLQMYGVPVGYFPFLAHPDPSVKRQSGLMPPWFGNSSRLGVFFAEPYYWAIDDHSDATFTPMMTTRAGPDLDIEYRRRFNNGTLLMNGSVGYVDRSLQGTFATRGQFSYDDTWRWGFDINRASSVNYLRDFHVGLGLVGDTNQLPSQVYLEGFGLGAYSRVETRFYQGMSGTIATSRLPIVLPRYQYSYMGRQDSLGGRLSFDAGAFNVYRTDGTGTRRASLSMNYDRPFTGRFGDLWKVTLHGDAAGYDVSQFDQQPNFVYQRHNTDSGRALPQLGVNVRWPFARESGSWGTQVIEPMLQVIVAPQAGDSQAFRYPNEDSLDLEFSDANLFGFNRFGGIDRLEGGQRANAALHGAWFLGGTTFDGMIGQSYRTTKDNLFPALSGLRDQVSDIVARGTLSPTHWLDLIYRTRLDKRSLEPRMVDTIASVGVPKFRVNAGYIHSTNNPYLLYDQAQPLPLNSPYYRPRNEVSLGLSSDWGKYRFTGFARRDMTDSRMVAIGSDAIYEDECFILDFRFYRRYTTINNDHGSTTLLVQFTFKTIGQFGYRAI